MTSPQKIGRYEILGELGRGAMGVVYKATDPNIGRTVALKTMRLDVHGADEEEILRRFKHEAKLAGVMNHANVVMIYDAGEDLGVFYIAMEYVEGVTLQSLLHRQRILSAQRILEISRQVCPAMDYAHERGVIHRDIKPANIMLTPQGGAKIMDFGIAKAAGGMTNAGQVLGTPAYMSPEQVRGKTLDGRSDLFSYGVCLYEMITGEKPFTGQNVTTIIYKIMNEEPAPPQELDLNVHPGISAIIIKALAKNPDQRFQSGAEMMQHLEGYKTFGDSDQTMVLSSTATAALDAPILIEEPKAERSKPGAVVQASKKLRQVASVIGGKAGPVEAIESTVTVMTRAAKPKNHLLLDKRLVAIVVIALLVVTSASVMLRRRSKVNETLTPAAGSQSAVTTSDPVREAATVTPANPQPATDDPVKEAPKNDVAANAVPLAVTKKPAAATKSAGKNLAANAGPVSAVTAPLVAAAPEEGSIHVTSTPDGAKVTIGTMSDPEWVTPFTAHKIPPGEQEITFTKPGYITQKRKTTVTADKTANIGIELAANGAKITVKSTPAGASILLDGKPTGKVTPAVIPVDAGTHQVIVRQMGYQEENTSVTLKDGENYDFSPTLAAARANGKNPLRAFKRIFGGNSIPEGQGLLQIRTNPPGAEVMHRGKAWPQVTPIRAPVDPGVYQVVLRLEGYKPARREFTVEKGKVTEIVVDLEPK